MKFKKIEFVRQTNFILALLLIHFVFFGYLSNVYKKNIRTGVLFLHQVLFPSMSISLFSLWTIIVVVLIIVMVFLVILTKIGFYENKLLIGLLALISLFLIIPIVLKALVTPGVLEIAIQAPVADFSLVILVGIVFFMVFRERFFEYGIRNSIWLIPFIIVQSWIWYWFISGEFDITVIGAYFLNINSYITILTLLGINLAAAILGATAREKYNAFIMRTKKIEV
ncbi:MAG: hypothetical protein EU531_03190 [Promethearchaeota archaeon]|nr:MAG: hypothetical protein EU531_03190 [Candidatus Lokiarchaeota archaeon]